MNNLIDLIVPVCFIVIIVYLTILVFGWLSGKFKHNIESVYFSAIRRFRLRKDHYSE